MINQEYFSKIQLRQTIATDFLSQSIRRFENGDEVTYLFKSDKSIYPHRLVLDKETKVVELSMYLSKEFRDEYQQNYNQLGTPDYSIVGADEITRNIFIERGEIYSFDYNKNLFMITVASSSRTEAKVAQLQDKAVESKNTISKMEIESENTATTIEVTPVPVGQSKSVIQTNMHAIISIMVLATVLVGYFFWQKRKNS